MWTAVLCLLEGRGQKLLSALAVCLFFPIIYSFIQSFIYIRIDSCIFTFTLVRIRSYFIYFVTQKNPILACRSSFSWRRVFDIPLPLCFVLLFVCFLALPYSLALSDPPGSSSVSCPISPRVLAPLLEDAIRNQDLSARSCLEQ